MQGPQHGRVQAVVDEHADCIETLGQAGGRGVQRRIEIGQLKPLPGVVARIRFIEETAVVRAGAEHGGFHGGNLGHA